MPGVRETAAVAVPPPGGGPSRLVVFLVPVADDPRPAGDFKPLLQQAVRTQLNPLFHIAEVRLVASLPRTASNKVMRRELRALCKNEALDAPKRAEVSIHDTGTRQTTASDGRHWTGRFRFAHVCSPHGPRPG